MGDENVKRMEKVRENLRISWEIIKKKERVNNKRIYIKNGLLIWSLMWLNSCVVKINITFKILNIYRWMDCLVYNLLPKKIPFFGGQLLFMARLVS